jgi:archaemetzincin
VALIALAAAGVVDGEALDAAEVCLARGLGATVHRVGPLDEPMYAFDCARGQYSSTLMLRDAIARRPTDAAKFLVVTERDIFIPMLSFVFGQAQLGGAVAILSLARLRLEFYGLGPNRGLFLSRVRKETLHEVGHTYGLTHCEDTGCTMALSTGVRQLDVKGGGFCSGCAILLREALGYVPPEEASNLPGGTT